MTMFRFLMAKQSEGFALFCGGNSGGAISVTEKYYYSNNAVYFGSSLSTPSWSHAACGLAEYALIGGGYNGSVTISTVQKYTNANDALSAGQSLLLARSACAASNNSSTGVWGGGDTTSFGANSKVTNIYQLSTNSVSSGVDLSMARRGLAGFASNTIAYFACGLLASATTNITDKFTIANNSITSNNVLSYRWGVSGVSNRANGYVFGGDPTFALNEQYILSNDSVSSKTSLSVGRLVHASSGNVLVAIISCGLNSLYATIKTSERYTYASNAMSSGTSLSANKESVSSASSTPGHL